jgi:hypothetical protein
MKTRKTLFSDITIKTRELLALNEVEPIYDFAQRGSDNPNTLDNIMKRQDALMDEIKEIAKAHNTLLGRDVRFPTGDGYAHYIITKVNKKTVEITWIKYCDAWQDSRAGYCANLDINFATQHVKGRDSLDEMFAKNKAKQLAKAEQQA